MSLVEYAKGELNRVDLEYDGEVGKAALAIVELFSTQGHSGGSAAITISVVERLLRFRPLTPLSGEDDEWTEVGPQLWQNKRSPSVFKDLERAWDIDLPCEGQRWQTITFPYMPGQDAFDRRAEKLQGAVDGRA